MLSYALPPPDDRAALLDLYRSARELERHPLVGARLVRDVALVAGDNRVRHGLVRATGRVLVRISAAVTLFDKDDSDPAFWVVNASGAATASFLFF